MTPRRLTLWAALIGVASAIVTMTVAELAAQFVSAASSPLFAVGAFVIDIVPPWVKETAIALFGTGDKVALLVGLGLLVAILAVAIGVLEYWRRPWGVVGLVIVGVIASTAAATRAGATLNWALPTAFGVVAGAFVLRVATDRLHGWAAASAKSSASDNTAAVQTRTDAATAVSRRGFLNVLGISAAAAVVATVVAQGMRAASSAANVVREAITFPKPAVAAPPIPAGAELNIDGLAPVISGNGTFYRIDTALQVPLIDAETWKLKVTGMVGNEFELTYRELLDLPLIETVATLACVSNEVGGDLIGNAVWLGYPIRDLLTMAAPKSAADMVLSRSVDGFTAGTPIEALRDKNRDAILAVAMNGEALPLAHGFPVRMVVPGLYGYVSATKWLSEMKVTRFEDDFGYWTPRGWSELGPVKTSSRIDTPRNNRSIPPGTTAIAGMAWAQHTGIAGVEVRIDGGPWAEARLADAISIDTWLQWVYEWDATAGDHTIEVRATDKSGFTQSETPVRVDPNGAEGWHTITVNVA